jgi:hypothetical protein
LREARDNHDFEKDLVGDDGDEEMPDAQEILARDSRSTRGQIPARSRMLQETFERLNSPEKRISKKRPAAEIQPASTTQRGRRQQRFKTVMKPRERKTRGGRVVQPTEKVRRDV